MLLPPPVCALNLNSGIKIKQPPPPQPLSSFEVAHVVVLHYIIINNLSAVMNHSLYTVSNSDPNYFFALLHKHYYFRAKLNNLMTLQSQSVRRNCSVLLIHPITVSTIVAFISSPDTAC